MLFLTIFLRNIYESLFMYTGMERRQHPRYSAGHMTASISFQDKSIGKVFAAKVQPIDFTISGIAIKTNINLEVGNKISLDISCGRNRASNIVSIVHTVVNKGNNHKYGLQFDFTANEYMCSEELEEILMNIEHTLKKNHKFTHRTPYHRIKILD
jgi:hypothetical protein